MNGWDEVGELDIAAAYGPFLGVFQSAEPLTTADFEAAWRLAEETIEEAVEPGAADDAQDPGHGWHHAAGHEEPEFTMPSAYAKGGSAILDEPDVIVPLWGYGTEVLMAEGEALLIASGQGAGKTTIGGQLALGLNGLPGFETLLGYPITNVGRVLYLAMDRPKQAIRSFKRMVTEKDREYLDRWLVIRKGPPLQDFAVDPSVLLRMCVEAGAKAVIVDSIKDAAVGLSKDEVGAAYNRARQTAITAGIHVIELHHLKKSQVAAVGKKKAEPTIDDIYGSTWITSGTGSVILLTGDPGDPVVGFHHLKQPLETVGPFDVEHDHVHGRSFRHETVDLVKLAAVHVLTASKAAQALFSVEDPTRAQVQKARRRLDVLEKAGKLTRHDTIPTLTWTAAK